MKLQIKRWLSQLFFLFTANLGFLGIKTGFCFPFFYCHACPTASAACPLRSLEISIFKISERLENFQLSLFLYPMLILGAVGIPTGRAVCGWACPIGLLQRATGGIARKFKSYSFAGKLSKHRIEPYLRYIKYLNLLALVFIIPILIGFMFTDICPVGFLTGTIPIMLLNPGKYIPSSYFYPALVIFILFLLLIFTIERGWCRYFCPVGAILAPFNKISYISVDVETEACIQCHLCSEICPMGINIPEMERDPECILCGKCIGQCPRSLIQFKRT